VYRRCVKYINIIVILANAIELTRERR
jgi:hypothetical protein